MTAVLSETTRVIRSITAVLSETTRVINQLAQVFSVSIDYLMYADSCCFCYTYDNRCLISASKRRPRSGFPRF
jgi:hypothetical protein